MNIIELTSQIDYVNNYETNILNDKNIIHNCAIVTLKNKEVCYGVEDSCNLEYCEENNIPYVWQKTLILGGCIVGLQGNLFIDVKSTFNNEHNIIVDFANALVEYFKSKGLNSVRCDNNDIMIDNYKVASGADYRYDKMHYMGYQISINQNLELIQNICNKSMEKIPKALSDYGITTEEMKTFCKNYWTNK